MMNLVGIEVEVALRILEDELQPHSELSRMFDMSRNYELSLPHHKKCVNILENINKLKSEMKGEFSFDYHKQHPIYG